MNHFAIARMWGEHAETTRHLMSTRVEREKNAQAAAQAASEATLDMLAKANPPAPAPEVPPGGAPPIEP